ncbi:hypothetical protein KKF82_09205 [Patescibacteria group bacterium]|nr:hypothetical protein [Patescibacteria group bacterium]
MEDPADVILDAMVARLAEEGLSATYMVGYTNPLTAIVKLAAGNGTSWTWMDYVPDTPEDMPDHDLQAVGRGFAEGILRDPRAR